MGFFDFLFSGGESSQLKKHIKRLNNLNVQQEERLMSVNGWLTIQSRSYLWLVTQVCPDI